VRKLYAGGAVIAESVVTSDEKEEGVAVVDMGSGVTDVAIYHGGVLCYMASIPMGGSALNADIRVYDGYIPPRIVENLKRKLGSAVVDLTPDEMIQMRSRSRSIKPISRLNLAAVIEARMTDITEYVMAEIRDAGYAKKLGAGIVLTGGVADLKNVAELFHRVTGFETRTACAEVGVATESLEKVYSPNLTMAVSLLLRGARDGACPVGVYIPRPKAEPEEAEVPRVTPEVVTPQPPVQQPPVQQPKDVEQPPVKETPEQKETLQEKDKDDDDILNDGEGDGEKKGGWFRGLIQRFSGAFNEPTDGDDSEDSW
jgi:cell division protein FtsA